MISFQRSTPPALQYAIWPRWSLERWAWYPFISFRSAVYNALLVATGAATAKVSGRERRMGFQLPAVRSSLVGASGGRPAVLSETLLLQAASRKRVPTERRNIVRFMTFCFVV